MRTLEFTQLGKPVAASEVPWFVTRIYIMSKRIGGIREAAAYDPEKLMSPRDLWPLHKAEELEQWFEQRRQLRENH